MKFDYMSRRAVKARIGSRYGRTMIFATLMVMGWVLVLGAVYVALVLNQPVAWLLLIAVAPMWMFGLWARALQQIAPLPAGDSIDAFMKSSLLGLIPRDPTPKQMSTIILDSFSGRFFSNRLMLSGAALVSQSSDSPADMDQIWETAFQMKNELGEQEVSSAMVVTALIKHADGMREYLPQIGITFDDIDVTMQWYDHLHDIYRTQRARKLNGGIARDWAFGFTPLLSQYGHNITEQILYGGHLARGLQSREQLVRHISELLTNASRRNVALVGQLGSGKTKIVHTLANTLIEGGPSVPAPLRFSQIISLDPSTLIANARGRGDLEHLVQSLCVEAIRAKNIIIFMDDAHLFFEEANGSVDLTNVLLPVLDGGALRLILAVDEQRWLQITQKNPGLAQYLNRVAVQPTTDAETMQVMQNQAIIVEHQHKVVFTLQALRATLQLSSRYIAEQVMPGRALTLLEAAAMHADNKLVTKQSVEQAVEQMSGVKVSTAGSQAERDTLLHLEERIHERMINQTNAVRVVSDALRRARAGVRNPTRPIGTFLFLGPTGVGKTELAKSVAAVFFGDEANLVRLDLNEFVRSEDVSRLIADPSRDSYGLLAQIMKQPYSVVLLDEIEKAHPEVLSTLLQMLDEGIMRDVNNREVSFRDAVIIATSNAGAEKIRAHIERGEQLEAFQEQFVNELIDSGIFRPEFLNRFDEIALFRPLAFQELLQVVDLILAGVNKTLSAQQLQISVAPDAKALLVQFGSDPRLGARPLRRAVQRTVENIVANKVLQQQAVPGSVMQISAADVQAMMNR